MLYKPCTKPSSWLIFLGTRRTAGGLGPLVQGDCNSAMWRKSSSASSLTFSGSLTCTFRDRCRSPPDIAQRTQFSCQGRPLQCIRKVRLLFGQRKGRPSQRVRKVLLHGDSRKGRPPHVLMVAVGVTLAVREQVPLKACLLLMG